jgi:arginase family enzyme
MARLWHGRGVRVKAMSAARWPRITDLFVADEARRVALLGAPMEAGSVTPGRCDLAPGDVRQALKRFSTYDVETGAGADARGPRPWRRPVQG